jgi:hypothetical protein
MIAPVIVAIGIWIMALCIGILVVIHFSSQRQIRALNDERIRLVQEIDQLKMEHSLELLAKGGGVK